jgi:SLOG cluster3 family
MATEYREMSSSIFLSASVPLPTRHEKYFSTADPIAIRDAIRALVTAVVPQGKIVFGGHPAITPMISLLIRERGLDVREHLVLYMSAFFAEQFPLEVSSFTNVNIVKREADSESSLLSMRMEMIRSEPFAAGIFIGGMEGVEDEYKLFRKIHPNTPTFPIGSTGAAALELALRHAPEVPDLTNDLRYLSLFRRLLKIKS